jgi:hypothetical protein
MRAFLQTHFDKEDVRDSFLKLNDILALKKDAAVSGLHFLYPHGDPRPALRAQMLDGHPTPTRDPQGRAHTPFDIYLGDRYTHVLDFVRESQATFEIFQNFFNTITRWAKAQEERSIFEARGGHYATLETALIPPTALDGLHKDQLKAFPHVSAFDHMTEGLFAGDDIQKLRTVLQNLVLVYTGHDSQDRADYSAEDVEGKKAVTVFFHKTLFPILEQFRVLQH